MIRLTILYPNDPSKEINQLKEVIEIIKNDKSNKILVTDYQFISVVLETYDYSPNKENLLILRSEGISVINLKDKKGRT